MTAQRFSFEGNNLTLIESQEVPVEVIFEFSYGFLSVISIESDGIGIAPSRSSADINIIFFIFIDIDHFCYRYVYDSGSDPYSFCFFDKMIQCFSIIENNGMGDVFQMVKSPWAM